jgi:hypothetical protein
MVARVIKKTASSMILEDAVTPPKQIKVRVSDRWSVVFDDQRYTKDDELSIPEHLAQEWERNHWIERVSSKS